MLNSNSFTRSLDFSIYIKYITDSETRFGMTRFFQKIPQSKQIVMLNSNSFTRSLDFSIYIKYITDSESKFGMTPFF